MCARVALTLDINSVQGAPSPLETGNRQHVAPGRMACAALSNRLSNHLSDHLHDASFDQMEWPNHQSIEQQRFCYTTHTGAGKVSHIHEQEQLLNP